MPAFPERKSLVELARGEPAEERDLVATRKVLLYLSPEGESTMDLEDEEMEHEVEIEHDLELDHELEDCPLAGSVPTAVTANGTPGTGTAACR